VSRHGAALAVDRVAPLAGSQVRLLPVVHERLESAAIVRATLDRLDPAAVAVELPTTLGSVVERAIARLPQISLVLSEEPGEATLVWVVAPGDPLVEGLRWALERGRPRFYVDPDFPYRERHRDPVPDPYAVWSLGAVAYLDLLRSPGEGAPGGEEDRRREAGMAFHLRAAAERLDGGEVVALVGAAHAERLAACLERPVAVPFARRRRTAVELRHLHPESLTALLGEPPLVHAAWELVRAGQLPPPTAFERTVAPRIVLERRGLKLLVGGEPSSLRERAFEAARYAARAAGRVLVPGCLCPDRWLVGEVALRIAAASYREQTTERLAAWQQRICTDFARRYARVEGLLVPGLYEWVVAARGVADDNFAWETFDVLATFPWQSAAAEIETARVDGEELDLGVRRVRFRRRFLRAKRRPVAIPVRRRPRPADPDDWLRGFADGGLCSYPPEDLIVEDYGRFLKQKAASILAAERERSEPFSASLLDGVDVRETLRHLEDDRVWVRELGRAPGEAGAVVVIFDRDREGDRFPFAMTWHGEHHQESDMAFYATAPGEQVVGPGILRATYGGFLLTHPPGRLWEVWEDPDYRPARDKGEVLLMAGVDYSLEKLVVHVAKEAPAERLRRFAAQRGKRIVHIPLGSLSPATVKKVRVVHLLAGRDKRRIAKQYVW